MSTSLPPATETADRAVTARIGRRAALVGLVALAAGGAGAWFSRARVAPAPVAAPDAAVRALLAQTLPDPAGTPQALAGYAGRLLVVNFWATWCAPCVEEMPELSALQTELGVDSVQILGIGVDSVRNVGEFAKKQPMSYPLFGAGASGIELARQFGDQAGGLPFTVVIDPAGRIAERVLGRVDIADLRRRLAALGAAR